MEVYTVCDEKEKQTGFKAASFATGRPAGSAAFGLVQRLRGRDLPIRSGSMYPVQKV